MKKKLILIASLVVIVALSIFYVQNNNLIADDKDKKDCSSSCTKTAGTMTESKSECSDKTKMSSASNTSDDDLVGFVAYEFVTDKIHCDGCKTEMTGNLMGISGVKEVVYGETCNVSKMTSVKVMYSGDETNPEIIAASVKEKGLQGKCEDGTKCDSKKKDEKKS
ncbi:MAG: hypothetical protein IPM38_12400 [Ignavibacteria bacterium]|nr:hypothetical protein [Ignavibacteria bacterium]